jgi:hypothetical protein
VLDYATTGIYKKNIAMLESRSVDCETGFHDENINFPGRWTAYEGEEG